MLARSAAASQFGVSAGLRDAGVDPASYKMQCAGKQKDYTKCRVELVLDGEEEERQ